MRELEIKLQFEHISAQEIIDTLASHGHPVTSSISQHDYVFASNRGAIQNPKTGTVVARVRVQGGQAFLTVKVRRAADLDRMEYETAVEDAAAAKKILSALGLAEIVRVNKTRSTIRLDEALSICVDHVEQLGTFVEIEILDDGRDDQTAVLHKRTEWVASMVGKPYSVVEQGYDRLLVAHDK